MGEQSPNLTVMSSVLNLPPKDMMLWRAQQHRESLQAAGYDGTTYYPLRNRLTRDMLYGQDVSDFVLAFQQSWREKSLPAGMYSAARVAVSRSTDGGLKGRLWAAAQEAAQPLIMPRLPASLGKIVPLQALISAQGGEMLPVIAHPQGQVLGNGVGRRRPPIPGYIQERLGELQWQPTAELAYNLGALGLSGTLRTKTIADVMVHHVHSQGFGRAAYDVGHSVAHRNVGKEKITFPNPIRMGSYFAANGNIGSVELGIQPDFHGVNVLPQILEGNIDKTPHGQVIDAIYSSLPADASIPPLRTEINASAFGKQDVQAGHQELVPILRDFVAGSLARR